MFTINNNYNLNITLNSAQIELEGTANVVLRIYCG